MDKTLEVVSQVEVSEADRAEEQPELALVSQADSSMDRDSCSSASQLAGSQQPDSDSHMDEDPEACSASLNRLNSENSAPQVTEPVFQISRNPGKLSNSNEEGLSRHSRVFSIQKMPGRR